MENKDILKGLAGDEVLKRQKEYGPNKIEEKEPTPLIILFLSQYIIKILKKKSRFKNN